MRDRWNLRGPVRACRTHRTWYLRACGTTACETEERSDVSTVEFRADGSLARQRHKNPDGSTWTLAYEYDEAGRLISTRSDDAGGTVNLQLYEYDPMGRLARIIARAHDGADRIAESYEYDAGGRKTKKLHIDIAGQRPDTRYCWGVEGTDSSYSAEGATTISTFYNELQQPISVVFQNDESRVLNRVDLVYDERGNLVEEASYIADMLPAEMLGSMNEAQASAVRAMFGATDGLRRMHRYDEQGRRVESRMQMGPLGGDIKTVAYNHYDDPAEEANEHEEREYNIDDEGRPSDSPTRESRHRSEARFLYEYDGRGNWVAKTVEGRGGPDQEFTVSSVERRTIDYFD